MVSQCVTESLCNLSLPLNARGEGGGEGLSCLERCWGLVLASAMPQCSSATATLADSQWRTDETPRCGLLSIFGVLLLHNLGES